MKLSRILQSQGLGTRRACSGMIRSGRVRVDGEICVDPDLEFNPAGLSFALDDEVWVYREKVYLVLHKPAGYECSQRPSRHPGVFALLPDALVQRGVQCVGRLDQDTTGLLLLSDDGPFIHRLTSPAKNVGKVYIVTCKYPVDDALLAALTNGVQLRGETAMTAARACVRVSASTLQLTLTEGKYHQVKRMIAAAGNHVVALHRAAIGHYALPADLQPGAWRWLGAEALRQLEGT